MSLQHAVSNAMGTRHENSDTGAGLGVGGQRESKEPGGEMVCAYEDRKWSKEYRGFSTPEETCTGIIASNS